MDGLHGGVIPDEVEPAGAGGVNVCLIDLPGGPLSVWVTVLPGKGPQDVLGPVPIAARAVGDVHDTVAPGPGIAGQGEVLRV